MPYNSPTLPDIINQLEGDIALNLDLGELPLICSERAIAFAVGAAKRDLHDHIDWLSQQIVPSANSDEQTIVDAAAYEGVPRKLAQKAAGTATIGGTDGSSLPIDTLFQHTNGLQYLVTDASVMVDGLIEFAMQCTTTGSAGNLVGETQELSLVSPVPGLQSKATISTLSGGADLEPISELLGRLYFRKQNPPMGGALHDYEAWATEVPEVTRAWAYDMYRGGSTVGLAFVCDNLDPITPTPEKVAEVDSYIYKHEDPATGRLVGRPGGIECITFELNLKKVQMQIILTPDNELTRQAVRDQLSGLERAYSYPNATIKLSQVRTAIGTAEGVTDYSCDLASDITSTSEELITFDEPTWTSSL